MCSARLRPRRITALRQERLTSGAEDTKKEDKP